MRFLLNVERDEFGLRRRKASPFTCIRGLLSLCKIMRLHVKGRFPIKYLANLILFTQPSAVSATAAK